MELTKPTEELQLCSSSSENEDGADSSEDGNLIIDVNFVSELSFQML